MSPHVTILLPTYKPNPDHLRAAITCVQKQTFTAWELFIHDDPSETDTHAILEPFLSDSRVHFYKSDHRLGIGGNWNACLKLGQGEFVQFLFQDDLWEPTYLEHAVQALKDPSIGFACAHHRYQFEGEIEPGKQQFYRDIEALRLKELQPGRNNKTGFLQKWIERGLRPNLIGEPSFVLLKRTLVDAVGPFREDMPQGLDTEYWLRCLVVSDFAFIPETLGGFRVHPSGASMRNDLEGHGLYDRLGFFETLLRTLPRGALRTQVKRSLVEQFSQMARKFFGRVHKGGKVGTGGSKVLIMTALRHPLLTLQGMLVFLTKRNGS